MLPFGANLLLMNLTSKTPRSCGLVVPQACLGLAAILLAASGCGRKEGPGAPEPPNAGTKSTNSEATVELTPDQLSAIKIGPVGTYRFAVEKDAVGSVSFDDDLSVPVFPSYQGKLMAALAELGDEVQKNQPLYSIESPDLIQAE